MPEPIWFFCTLCGELFPWPADKERPTRCPVENCPQTDIHPAPAPKPPNSAPTTKAAALRRP